MYLYIYTCICTNIHIVYEYIHIYKYICKYMQLLCKVFRIKTEKFLVTLPFDSYQDESLLFSHCCVQLFVTPWTAARQASLSFTIFWSLLTLMSMASMTPSNHLILCRLLLLLPSIFPSIRVFSNGLALCIRWPKHWSSNLCPIFCPLMS